ncbi:hypothetical protein Dimus_026840 [Dionaea muscipula]
MNQQIDDLLARPFISEALDEEVQEEQVVEKAEKDALIRDEENDKEKVRGDVGTSSSKRSHRERSLFTPIRLSVPSRKTVRRCMDSLMGASTHTTIRSMRRLPLKHKCAILCRNMAELSLLTGDVLFSAVRTEEQRCRDGYGENQTLEKKNEELENKYEEMKSALEGEKRRAQTLEEKVKELQAALKKEKEEKQKKDGELVASYKKHQELLKRKMDLDTSL